MNQKSIPEKRVVSGGGSSKLTFMSEQMNRPKNSGSTNEGQIQCGRCGESKPQLEEPPFENSLGERIQETICQSCWGEWINLSVRVINEYRLNLAIEEHSRILESHMKQFLGIPKS